MRVPMNPFFGLVGHRSRHRQYWIGDDLEPGLRSAISMFVSVIRVVSRAIGSVSVEVKVGNVPSLALLPFVGELDLVLVAPLGVGIGPDLDIAREVVQASDMQFNFGYDGTGIRIAFVDTGIDATHIASSGAFGSRIVDQWDFVENDGVAQDTYGHGTLVAGAAAARGGRGRPYVGAAPGASLLVYQAANQTETVEDRFVAAIDRATSQGAHVISLSWSFGTGDDGTARMSLRADRAAEDGIIFVKSAGNAGPGSGTITTPGTAFNVITVGAHDDKNTLSTSDDILWDGSSRGPTVDGRMKPDAAAPGVNIITTRPAGIVLAGCTESDHPMYQQCSGTSFAAPLVAGVAALLKQAHPDWTPNKIKDAIRRGALDMGTAGRDNDWGFGIARAIASHQSNPDGTLGWDTFSRASPIRRDGDVERYVSYF